MMIVLQTSAVGAVCDRALVDCANRAVSDRAYSSKVAFSIPATCCRADSQVQVVDQMQLGAPGDASRIRMRMPL